MNITSFLRSIAVIGMLLKVITADKRSITTTLAKQISPATLALVRHFEWDDVVLVVEDDDLFVEAEFAIAEALPVKTKLHKYTMEFKNIMEPASIKKVMEKASKKAKVIILLMSLNLAKECLVSGHDLKLDKGDYMFIVFDVTIVSMSFRQSKPWQWLLAMSNNSRLCDMWRVTLVVKSQLSNAKAKLINNRALVLYDTISAQAKEIMSVLDVYDWKSLEDSVFRIIDEKQVIMDKNGKLKYPLAIHHYGKSKGSGKVCKDCLANEEIHGNSSCSYTKEGYPVMTPISNFVTSIDVLSKKIHLGLSVDDLKKRVRDIWP